MPVEELRIEIQVPGLSPNTQLHVVNPSAKRSDRVVLLHRPDAPAIEPDDHVAAARSNAATSALNSREPDSRWPSNTPLQRTIGAGMIDK